MITHVAVTLSLGIHVNFFYDRQHFAEDILNPTLLICVGEAMYCRQMKG